VPWPSYPSLSPSNMLATLYLGTTGLTFVKMVKKNEFPPEMTLPSFPVV